MGVQKIIQILALMLITIANVALGAQNILLMTIIEENPDEFTKATTNAMAFVAKVNEGSDKCSDALLCLLFFRYESKDLITQSLKDTIASAKVEIAISNTPTIRDHSNLGTPKPYVEHVSLILRSINDTLSSSKIASDCSLVSMSFHADSYPVASSTFSAVYKKIAHSSVMLLEKNQKLNSVSDWQDLMVVGLNIGKNGVRDFVHKLLSIYLRHADRPVFQLFPPRGAIMETTLQMRSKVTIDYFARKDICVLPWIESKQRDSAPHHSLYGHGHGQHTSFCRDQADKSHEVPVEIQCGDGMTLFSHSCSTVHIPHGWSNNIHHLDKNSLSNKFGTAPEELMKMMPQRQHLGTVRYRETKHEDMLADYCWDTGWVSTAMAFL